MRKIYRVAYQKKALTLLSRLPPSLTCLKVYKGIKMPMSDLLSKSLTVFASPYKMYGEVWGGSMSMYLYYF